MDAGRKLAALVVLGLCAGMLAGSAGAAEDEKGLTAKLVKKKITRSRGGREFSYDALVLEIKNEGEATVLLPSPPPVELFARDAEGNEVPPREPREEDEGEDDKKEGAEKDPGTTITILETGQTVEVTCRTRDLDFPKEGKYTVWAVVKLEPADDEVLPGLKLWSGELKSNELEWDVQRLRGGRGGGRGGAAGGGADAPKPEPAPETKPAEEF